MDLLKHLRGMFVSGRQDSFTAVSGSRFVSGTMLFHFFGTPMDFVSHVLQPVLLQDLSGFVQCPDVTLVFVSVRPSFFAFAPLSHFAFVHFTFAHLAFVHLARTHLVFLAFAVGAVAFPFLAVMSKFLLFSFRGFELLLQFQLGSFNLQSRSLTFQFHLFALSFNFDALVLNERSVVCLVMFRVTRPVLRFVIVAVALLGNPNLPVFVNPDHDLRLVDRQVDVLHLRHGRRRGRRVCMHGRARLWDAPPACVRAAASGWILHHVSNALQLSDGDSQRAFHVFADIVAIQLALHASDLAFHLFRPACADCSR
ncbi:MAG: hypothetical protein R3C19_25150 [Planctomycetaceae bacterium]